MLGGGSRGKWNPTGLETADVEQATEIAPYAPGPGDSRVDAASGVGEDDPDVPAAYEALKRRGVTFTLELVRHGYGKGQGDQEARFVDPDGNEFLLHT